MFHVIEEGEKKHFGINFVRNKKSIVIVAIVIPIQRYYLEEIQSEKHGHAVCFYFRIRKWWKFKKLQLNEIFIYRSMIFCMDQNDEENLFVNYNIKHGELNAT